MLNTSRMPSPLTSPRAGRSPSKSPVAVRTATPSPPNGLTVAAGVVLNWPDPFGANTTADPLSSPPTASGRPGEGTGAVLVSGKTAGVATPATVAVTVYAPPA